MPQLKQLIQYKKRWIKIQEYKKVKDVIFIYEDKYDGNRTNISREELHDLNERLRKEELITIKELQEEIILLIRINGTKNIIIFFLGLFSIASFILNIVLAVN